MTISQVLVKETELATVEVIVPGPAGVGSAWQQGAGAPSSGVGGIGDFYLNTTTGDIYGPKTSNGWGSVIFNIAEGQQGPAGEPGPAGQSGAAGSAGPAIELQVSGGYIQWRPVGAQNWNNLLDVADITGPAGATGSQGLAGATGAAGANGKTVLSGSGAPSGGTGTDGDFYIDVAASRIYGPRASGAWGSGTSLVGPAGAAGATGATGPQGATGPAGADATYSNATPQPLGTAAAGTATSAARADHVHALPSLAALGAVATTDSRLSDSREWSAATATQAEAEAGTSTSRLAFTPQRVFQAVAAWWAASTAKTKLDGIATGATANSSDATLLNRANHTGTQTASTISDFTSAASAAAPVQSVAGRTGSVTLSSSDISGLGTAATAATADFLPMAFTLSAINWASTVDLDMAALAGGYRTLALAGNLTFTTSNRASGRTVVLRLVCDSSQRTLTFPAGWVFVGTKPANIAASKTAVLSLTFFGTTDTDCVAAYGVQA